MADNRRRIKPELLGEIEGHEGDTFTEQLLNWNRKQDTLSEDELEEKFSRAMDRFRKKLDEEQDNVSGVDYAHIQNLVEQEADRVIEQLGGRR